MYFSRSLATIALLEADARRAAGQVTRGDSLARLVSTHQIVDGHFEAWAAIRAVSAIRDSLGRRGGLTARQRGAMIR